jgi:glycosyltransferase involved in cell wall biosynthesis
VSRAGRGRKRTFVALFPGAYDHHLRKDVGMIPYVLGRDHGYDARLATFANDAVYPSLADVPGLSLEVIPAAPDGTPEEAVLGWLQREAGAIDVLQVYHWLPATLELVSAYRRANPSGVVWLKLDANRAVVERPFTEQFSAREQKIIRACDLVTVETRELHQRLLADWPMRVELVPNGYDERTHMPFPYAAKEDVVCTVGRLGTYQKGTDVLVEAFVRTCRLLTGYELCLVGSMEPAFARWLDERLAGEPELAGRIVLTGELGRAEVDAELRRARIFCLPSRWEGFGLVLPEALAAGCRLVVSDTPAARDVTDGGRFGDVFPVDDVDALATCLLRACTPGDDSAGLAAEAQVYARDTFAWGQIGVTIDFLVERARSTRAGTSRPATPAADGGSTRPGGAPSPR